MPKRFAVIVAGGAGFRMKSEVPKQFLLLNQKPLLFHTIEAFYQFDPDMELICVLPAQHINKFNELCREYGFSIPHKAVPGGETRFHSVKNGLDTIDGEGVVGIHDGVRPLVSQKTLRNTYTGAERNGNAVPVIPPVESVRVLKENDNQFISRNQIRLVQTPQCFEVSLIKKAFQQDYAPHFTDDATVLESIGIPVHLVEGNRENIKITTTVDLALAEALLTAWE